MSTSGDLLADRYRLERWIAAGAVGEVWRATDLVLGRPVAVKRLRDGYTGQPAAIARFRAEARHAGALSHAGIAQVYDYGEADPPNPPFLVMEFVDGPSLAGLLASGPLPPGDAMDVLAQVAAGLAAAHAAGLVHRDIKPANLLVAPDGQVKITDFGIAHAAGSAQLTQAGTTVGTPSYLAPERAAGADATPASDLYSLGVVAYECLAGQPPFQGTPMEVVAATQRDPLPPLPATVPAAVAALVTELTAKDPAARPASASEVAARAARLRDGLRDGPAATVAGQLGPGPAGPSGAWPADPSGAWPADPPGAWLADPPGAWPPDPAGVPAGAAAGSAGSPGATAVLAAMPVLDEPAGWPPDDGRDWPAGPGRAGSDPQPPGWARPGVVLAVVAAVLIVVLGWLLLSHGGTRPGTAASTPRATAARSAQARTVTVDAAALTGQPIRVARQRLAQLGLSTHVVGQVSDQQPPGTVLSVHPSGPVPAGSVVTVLVAQRPGGDQHGHGHGNGHGDGGQQGNGNGNGGD